MALYKHITSKEDIFDGIIEVVVGQIEIPAAGTDWKEAMRRRAISAREVLARHSWAIGLLESRGSKGRTVLRYMEAIIGTLRAAGFSIESAIHAFWLLDSYVYGHVIQETSMASAAEANEYAGALLQQITEGEFPYLYEMGEHAATSGYSFDREFEVGLELILDALSRTGPTVP
jgi:hypothetical protein